MESLTSSQQQGGDSCRLTRVFFYAFDDCYEDDMLLFFSTPSNIFWATDCQWFPEATLTVRSTTNYANSVIETGDIFTWIQLSGFINWAFLLNKLLLPTSSIPCPPVICFTSLGDRLALAPGPGVLGRQAGSSLIAS